MCNLFTRAELNAMHVAVQGSGTCQCSRLNCGDFIFCLLNSQLCSTKICFSKETPVIRKRRDRQLCCFTDVVSIALPYGR